MKSEQINELATALCKMQGLLHDTPKDKPAYNYKYSDLSQILTYIRPLMADNGLSVSQLVNGDTSGQIGVETILMHNSGQWLSTTACMSVQGQNLAQEAGKVVTYLRRYQLAAVIGLTQADNDAQLSNTKTEKSNTKVTKASLTETETKAIDALFRHAENKDAAGMSETYNELTTEEAGHVWEKLPSDTRNYLAEVML